MSTYAETLEWLYAQLPVFQHTGGTQATYKVDLAKTMAFMEALGHPERRFPAFHVAGTNGKGSTSHMLASCLQEAGYRVGLYTSPHLVSFTERIRIQGVELAPEKVVDFVETWKPRLRSLQLSFFEMSVGLAFHAFAEAEVDVAVIEVGMGGRLDSTNVVHPIVTGVTTIDLDHQAFLGTTRAAIAREKAGIFKPHIPAVVGQKDDETQSVFESIANHVQAPLIWAEDYPKALTPSDLLGEYQADNQRMARAMMAAQTDFPVSEDAMARGLARVVANTGLQGRWQVWSQAPMTILDTAHNPHGLRATMRQLQALPGGPLHIVLGMVQDKDVRSALACLPAEASYYYCAAHIPRAMPAEQLQALGESMGLQGATYPHVKAAWDAALQAANPEDRLYIGGSTFVVADALTARR